MRVRRARDLAGGLVRNDPGSAPTGEATPRPVASERLDYIADMLQELKKLSQPGNCEILTGLLDLAYREAIGRRRAR
jgi:hypothetical protein